MRRSSPPPSNATVPSPRGARSTSPETMLVSSASVPRRASSSQRSMPARLPVVTEVQPSPVPGLVSTTLRSGLRKFTGANRTTRLPLSVNLPRHIVSRPRPRYSAPCQLMRTRRPRLDAAKGRAVCTTLAPCSTSRRSIGAVPMTSVASRIGTAPGRMMSPMKPSRTVNSSARAICGSSEKTRDRLIERPAQVEEDASAGGAIVTPAAQRLEQGVAGEVGHEVAGQPADRAEGGGARPRRARSSLVIVAVAHDPDAIAFLERVVQQPFESAPGRMHLDAALEPPVMGGFDIRVTPPDVGDDHRVLAVERAKEFIRGVNGSARGLSFDQDVRR